MGTGVVLGVRLDVKPVSGSLTTRYGLPKHRTYFRINYIYDL